jgi:serine/threonine protein kinase
MATVTKIGRFRIIQELGKDSQGIVFLAEDTRCGRTVAIKTLDMHIAKWSDPKLQPMHAARAACKLRHPNIVTVHEVGEHDGTPYSYLNT